MGMKKVQALQNQIKDARAALKELQEKKDRKLAKEQHKVIDDLEVMMSDESLRQESLLELGEEAWQEAKNLLFKVKSLLTSNANQ